MTDRREFLALAATAGFSPKVAAAFWTRFRPGKTEVPAALKLPRSQGTQSPITREMVKAAEALEGLTFTDAERDLMLSLLESTRGAFQVVRSVPLPNDVPLALQFNPALAGRRYAGSTRPAGGRTHSRPAVKLPGSKAELAFLSTIELAQLIRTRQVSSTELTRLYLERLEQYDPSLRCVVTLTVERALRRAAQADREIAAGRYRGPLHGIPYGVKDLFAVAGYPTTWGYARFRDRVIDSTATVVERLDEAGAVLIAKLSMGELGLNDSWYRGRTMNPWRPSQGATGSSAGSAVSASAGLVGFAIGTETMASIISPAARTGVTGLRPTFGRISRHGAMSLCWSLDKVGALTRSVEDAAVILEVLAGPDGKDPVVSAVPYAWNPDRPLSAVKVGYFKGAFDIPRSGKPRDDLVLERLRGLGVSLLEVELPTDLPINELLVIRYEAAASLFEFFQAGGLGELTEQHVDGWPNIIRGGQFFSAVHYLQANRVRSLLMQRLDRVFRDVDLFVAPTFGVLPLTNLTGHPAVVVPNGLTSDGMPASISFIGQLYGESRLCTVARAWQDATGFHKQHPAGFSD